MKLAGLAFFLWFILTGIAHADTSTTNLNPGDTASLSCPSGLTITVSDARNLVVTCLGVTPTPSLGPNPTSVPSPIVTPTITSTLTPTEASTETPIPSPTWTPQPPTITPSSTPTSAPPGSLAGLHVVGSAIQNGAGQTVLFHGVVQQGGEYACLGSSGTNGYAFFDDPANQAVIDAYKAWNANIVRVQMNEDCWLGINGVSPTYSGNNYQLAMVSWVSQLTSNGLVVILNLHFSAPGTTRATGQAFMADQDHSPAFWTGVASTFRDNPMVLYEPYNEPQMADTAAGWQCWVDGGNCTGVSWRVAGMQQLVGVIRATGATQPIILDTPKYSTAEGSWAQFVPKDTMNPDQLIAGFHSYGDGLACQNLACWNTTLAAVLTTSPLLATEIGEFDCKTTYIDPLMSWFDQHQQGYLAYAFGPFGCTANPALVTNINGTPTANYGVGYKAHIQNLTTFAN